MENNNKEENKQTNNTTTTDSSSTQQQQPAKASGGGGWSSWGGWGLNNIIESVQKINIMEQVNQQVQNIQQMNSGLVDTIMSKSDAMVNLYKEDLKEFSNSLMSDTTQIIQSQYDNVKQYIPESISNVVDDLNISGSNNNAITDNNNNNNTTLGNTPIKSPTTNILLKSISFFTSDPTDIQEFEHWCIEFGDLESHSLEINTILSGDDGVKALYGSYVPAKISHHQFWLKYFYKQYKTQKEEEKRQLIFQQVTQSKEEEEVGWSEGEDFDEDEQETISNNINQTANDFVQKYNSGDDNENYGEKDDDEISNTATIATTNTTTTTTNTTPNKQQLSEEEYIDTDDELDREIERKYLEEQKLFEIEKLKKQQQKQQQDDDYFNNGSTQQQQIEDYDNENVNENDVDFTPSSTLPNTQTEEILQPSKPIISHDAEPIHITNSVDDEDEEVGWD